MAKATNDKVIEDLDFELMGGLNNLPGDLNIRLGGSRISARVIMDHNEACSAELKGPLHHFSRKNRGAIDSSLLLNLIRDDFVFLIKKEESKLLHS